METQYLKSVLEEQFRAGLAMLAESVQKCPDDLWISPLTSMPFADIINPPWNGIERSYWRIAFHTAYFTHLYLGQNESAFVPPPLDLKIRSRESFEPMWRAPWDLEPYELPLGTPPCSKHEIWGYIEFIDSLIIPTIDGLDLSSPDSGFPWYPNLNKLSHQLLNLRHLQGHIGQLSELLMARGFDIGWISKVD